MRRRPIDRAETALDGWNVCVMLLSPRHFNPLAAVDTLFLTTTQVAFERLMSAIL